MPSTLMRSAITGIGDGAIGLTGGTPAQPATRKDATANPMVRYAIPLYFPASKEIIFPSPPYADDFIGGFHFISF
jgi:hypothetical protein